MGLKFCTVSASVGALDVLKWLLKHSFEIDSDTCRAAIKAGELELLEFAMDTGGCKMDEEVTEYACEWAALIGNQAMLEYVRTCGATGWGVEVSAAAAFNGDLPMLEYLWRHKCLFDASCISRAASQGHLSVVKWLLKKGCPCDDKLCSEAAGGGHTEILEWALLQNLPWDAFTCAKNAAEGGHLGTLKCVIANEANWDAGTMSLAALSGNLAMVKWMVEKGCPVSPRANTYAAFKGHLPIMKWLRKNDYKWDLKQSYIFAAGGGHVDVLEWLFVNECPRTTPISMAFNATKNGHLLVLEWMGKNTGIVEKFNTHVQQKNLCAQAAEHGHLEVLKYLRLNEVAWEEERCMGHAAYNGHLEIVKWIYKGRSEGMKFTEKEALDGGHLSVLWWAFEKGLIESKRS